MPMFVNPDDRVPVTVGENTIYIRAKMSVGVRARVNDEISLLASKSAGTGDGVTGLGSYRLALLVHNIVDWEGPDFTDAQGRKIPCARQYIERLDLDEPLVEAVREEIGRRNQARTEVAESDPN